jgi:hypothetical protein
MLVENTGEHASEMLRKLMLAAREGALPVYEPGKKAKYEYGCGKAIAVREFYEEAYWNDLNDWLKLNEPRVSYRFPEPVDSIIEKRAFEAAFVEPVSINWRYWVHQMPTLTAGQAARLISGLEPDVFENLDNGANGDDLLRQLCENAKKIQRLAETEGNLSATPSEWLKWADARKFKVHDLFRIEVEKITCNPPAADEASNASLVGNSARLVASARPNVGINDRAAEAPVAEGNDRSVDAFGIQTRQNGEPWLVKGKNRRKQVDAWVKWQAKEIVEPNDKGNDLAERIQLIADKWGYESEREKLTIASITKMLPAGITGGRAKARGRPKR